MPDNQVRIKVGADLTRAEAAMEGFAARAPRSVKPLDDSLLSSREAARLLSEEFGVHLPRAVTGAIAEMVPAISALGPVMLGAFAIMEIPKLVSGIRDAVQSWEGFGAAEQEAMKKAIADTEALHGKVIDVERELQLFEKSEAQQAALHAKWAGESADRALKALQAAEHTVAGIKAQQAKAMDEAGMYAEIAGDAFTKPLMGAQAEVNKLREAWKLAEDQALLAQKQSKEAAESQAAAAAKSAAQDAHRGDTEAARAAREQAEEARKALEVQHRLREEEIKGGQEAGKVAAAIAKQNAEAAASADRAAQAEIRFAVSLEEFGIVGQRDLSFIKQLLPNMDGLIEKTVHLSGERKAQIAITQELRQVEAAFSQALKGEMGALEGLTKGTQSMVEDVTALMGNTRATAEIRGAMDAALAIEYGADAAACLFSGDFSGAAEAAEASLQYAAAAKAMFKAGGGGGSISSSSGGAGGGGSRSSGAGGGGQAVDRGGSGGGSNGGSRGAYSQTTIHVQGVISADTMQQFYAQANVGQSNGLIKVNANSVSSIPAPRA